MRVFVLLLGIGAAFLAGGTRAAGSSIAAAVPQPPPKFWSSDRCERVLLGVYGYAARMPPGGSGGFPLPDGNGHSFHVGQAICVGSGGADACRWTTGHRSRLYSEFTVFTRSPLNGGVVRSWTLATRAGHGRVPIAHHAGDQYVGWPPDFYMSRTKLLATDATSARFRSIVAPIAARVTQQENTTGCTSAS
jgi:hypothetical protein